MKRFYKIVTAHLLANGTCEIHLDGKPVKLPSSKGKLLAPNDKIARAVQQEWAAQTKEIKPNTMPLTQILTTAQDRVNFERGVMQATVAAYLDTDLLCYRAMSPPEMINRQAQLWDPWLEWFVEKYGARLATTQELSALHQPLAAHEAIVKTIQELDDLHFTLLQLVVSISSSLVLGLAFIAGAASAEKIMAAIYAEEDLKGEIYGAARYGFAPQEEADRAGIFADLKAANFIRNNL